MNYPKHRYTGEKPWMNKEWLYDQYITKNKTSQEIADEYGCKQNTIQQWLRRHNIKKPILTHKRKKKHQYELYDYLYNRHIELNKTIQEIATENNVSYDTIVYHLKKNNIEIIKHKSHVRYSDEDISTIIELYCEEMLSANQIAKLFNTQHNVIIHLLQRYGVDTRNMSEAQYIANGKILPSELLNAELLQKMHWDDNKSCKEIGKKFGIDGGTVRRQMHRLGLSTKSNSESKIGLMTGEKHPNWQGGRTSLKALLREYFQVNQLPIIAKRDNYTCQLCGATHTVLHIHHIKEFHKIVDEICDEYPMLNPDITEDKMKLYDVITHDVRFLDENNLITFCKDCHFFKIHNYKKRKTISSQASKEEGSETIPNGSTS
jgi:transposase